MERHSPVGEQSLMCRSRLRQPGFTYMGLMFILVMLGLTLSLAGVLWSFSQTREKERELLFIGNQFRQAIRMYYEKTPGIIKRYPMSLDQLLEDDRYVSTQRYLRRIYRDPMTGLSKWGTVMAPDGGIMGIYSLSTQLGLKNGTFIGALKGESIGGPYNSWRFVYLPGISSVTSVGK